MKKNHSKDIEERSKNDAISANLMRRPENAHTMSRLLKSSV